MSAHWSALGMGFRYLNGLASRENLDAFLGLIDLAAQQGWAPEVACTTGRWTSADAYGQDPLTNPPAATKKPRQWQG